MFFSSGYCINSSKAKKEIEKLSESYFNSYLINDEDVIDLYQKNNKNECKKTKNLHLHH
jgi:hypothetical protein